MESFSNTRSARERAQRKENEDARDGEERDDAAVVALGRCFRLRLCSGGWERDRFARAALPRRVPDALPRDSRRTLFRSRGVGALRPSVARLHPVRSRRVDRTPCLR